MSVAFRPRRASIRRRLLAAFVFLALSMGAALGLAGRLSFDSLGTALLAWHTRPVMDALMEAERRAWEAEDRGGEKPCYGEDLAAVMHGRFLVGKEVGVKLFSQVIVILSNYIFSKVLIFKKK